MHYEVALAEDIDIYIKENVTASVVKESAKLKNLKTRKIIEESIKIEAAARNKI